MESRNHLRTQISDLLNCFSRESESDTPDFILAEYLLKALEAFEDATRNREQWYGGKVKQCHTKDI